jgi:DNA polymerase I-like protein with 3'-5' exonuclease and polymerase domains
MLALDIETTGFDPETADLVLISLATEDWCEVLDVRAAKPSWIRSFLEDCFQHPLVVHNAAFDLVFLHRKFGVPFPERVWDTMLAEQLLTAGLPLAVSLEETAQRRLGIRLDKALQSSFHDLSELTPEQIAYAEQDARVLIPLAKVQRALLSEQQMGRVWAIERDAQPVFWEMTARGIRIDLDALADLHRQLETELSTLSETLTVALTTHVEWLRRAKYETQLGKLHDWLDRYEQASAEWGAVWDNEVRPLLSGTEPFVFEDDLIDLSERLPFPLTPKHCELAIDRKDGIPKGRKRFVKDALKHWREANPRPPKPKLDITPINLDSPEQLCAALESLLGREVPDVRAPTLKSLLTELSGEQAETVRQVLHRKRVAKIVQAFTGRIPSFVGPDGRLRGNVRQIGTATGRPSSSNPNLLQMPGTHEFRRLFLPSPGNVLVVADFSQMELRIMAELSGDRNMVSAFVDGRDLHRATAALIFGVDDGAVTDTQRKIAKTINFGTLYGMGVGKLRSVLASEGIRITESEAQDFLQRWRDAFRDADRALRSWSERALRTGWSRTPLGRKRFFDLTVQDEQEVRRAAANHVIQGGNADITKIAMRNVQDAVSRWGGSVLLQVYDELVVDVPASAGADAREAVVREMERAAREVLKTVPPGVDAVVSRSWSERDAVVTV